MQDLSTVICYCDGNSFVNTTSTRPQILKDNKKAIAELKKS